MGLLTDFRYAIRSLARARGLALTVIVTLALGIGANAAIFSVVRGVLLAPLVNDDEERLVYIRQSAPGRGAENVNFSVPEINDLQAGLKTIGKLGDFSTIDFTLVGLGEPRVVRAGVVSGSFFPVMGLQPIRGRLIDATDDGPQAASVTVLTHRFWTESLGSDETLLGKQIKLGDRASTIIGILEPSVPYPAETQLIANVVTSSHHMSATMQDGRVHRMTELFGRLVPGASLEQAVAELRTVHAAMMAAHKEAYPPRDDFRINAVRLRDQITSPARTILLVLLGASGLIFIIACSNVANLILARSVRREGELAVRAALGAGVGALRRTLLAESVLLCGAGAVLGVLIARPMLNVIARYASRYSVRALDLTVDSTLLWVGVTLALISSVLLAFVPRLPSADSAAGLGLSTGSVRVTSGTNRRLQAFAVTQIAASFVLLAGAGALLATLIALQRQNTGVDLRNVLAVHVPLNFERPPEQTLPLYREAIRKIGDLPGVEQVAVGTIVPWREAGAFFDAQFTVEGYQKADGEDDPRASFRTVSPGFFRSLGVPIIAGRDFNDNDRSDTEKVVIISESVARRMFNTQEVVNRKLMWTDPVMKFIGISTGGRRIVGIAADLDDENIVPGPKLTVYHPMEQEFGGGRLFVHAKVDPYTLVTPITKIIRDISAEQPVERAATLEDVRAEVLAPNRVNTLVFGGFALVALTIAIVGVAGVLAFSVSARMREFGVRLAIGSTPSDLLTRILKEGALIAAAGIVTGIIAGFALLRFAGGFFGEIEVPGVMPLAGAAAVLIAAAVVASLMPATRASRVDVMEALRSE
ncbi:MAG TPA: ADOP family duplicated permease [Vicinamibacterales bacterium]|nr:ADOP family duplicated permease [Vicinamibacterales bacterium]